MSVLASVRRTIERRGLASAATRVAVAYSGGPDSTALLHLLRALHDAGDLQLVGAVHLNHQLRLQSDGDEHHCRQQAEALGVAFVAERADVRQLATNEGVSLEDAAHRVRWAFYERAARQLEADVVAVGHTRDDQAETFLLRLLRGAGSRGLAAMYPRSGVVIRPLLDCSRDAVRAFLIERDLTFVCDASNDDLSIPRNRVRAGLLPLLTERFNPRVVEALAREADLARADEAYLESEASAWAARHLLRPRDGEIRIDADLLAALPEAIRRRAVRSAMLQASGNGPIGLEHVDGALRVAAGSMDRLDAPGHAVQRDGRYVVLMSRPAGSAGRFPVGLVAPVPAFRYPLPIPGEVSVPEIGCALSTEVFPSVSDVPPPTGVTAVVPRNLVAGGLAVRNRRPGDRLKPSAVGTRKLQDLLVDRKVPRAERDRIPIVTDSEGRIVWVAGHALDEVFRVSDPAQAVVVLRLNGVGGSC